MKARKLQSATREDSGVRRVRAPRTMQTLGVVDQVREALKPRNRLAACLGALLGGIVPVASYVVAHHELEATRPWWGQFASLLVAGGLLYSARTVYGWGRLAFGEPAKALGFVVLLEGVMVLSTTPWLALTCLAYLVGINSVSTGCALSLGRAGR